jgi:integrase
MAGLMAAETAASINDVKGAPRRGNRVGNWLTREQAQELLSLPDRESLKGKRDFAILALLLVLLNNLNHRARREILTSDFAPAPHDMRRTCAKLCRKRGGDLEQIKFLLGHASIQTTERYLGAEQDFVSAVNDNLGLER